ncbi:LysR family transcriptional regulator [Nocardiopsis composta]|uniref:DNA-binding transcriptional LysR family regulator n=1 Tax=Nocardiopsis composta TaxID=157465 RepID=A0A7W8QI23_9ACTN|nr:DNA-binding transcriptional LysR family regulator [Nocardiopsis composta]
MHLNLHRLEIFLRVLEHGSFSAAAQKLYMSQPSVSTQVKKLEASMGATLVDRSGARIRPTAEGEALAQYARRLLLLTEEAVAAVEQIQGLRAGRLRVGGTTTVGTYLLPGLTARFREEFPGVEFDLFVGNSGQVEAALLEGEIGLAVVAGGPSAPQLLVEPLLSDGLLLCADPGHRLAGAAGPLDPGELSGERFLLREPGSSTRDEQLATLELWGLTGAATADVWGAETAKQAVGAGLGIALLSEHAVARDVATGSLAVLDVRPRRPGRPIMVCHRRDRVLSPAESVFLARLRALRHWPEG